MKIGSISFSPRLWSCMVTAAFLLVFFRLGFWQLDRARLKEGLLDDIESRQAQAELNEFGSTATAEDLAWRRARLSGTFQATPTILLDNRVHLGRTGYFVYSVFQTLDGLNVLVNRGWVQAMPRRNELPKTSAPADTREIAGTLKMPPRTGKLLANNTDELLPGEVIRLQFLDIAHVNENYNLRLEPFILRLDEQSQASFQLDWPSPATGKEKHLGYAFQWFAMAAALTVIFIALNSKRIENHD